MRKRTESMHNPGAIIAAAAILFAVVIAAIIIGIVSIIHLSTSNSTEFPASNTLSADAHDKPEAFILTREDLNTIPDDENTIAFSLSAAETPAIDEEKIQAIDDAIDHLSEVNGFPAYASFALVNTQTGKGIAHDAVRPIYGASTFKALYALYLCEALVEKEELSLEDTCPSHFGFDSIEGQESSNNTPYEEYASVRNLIRCAILYSDNYAFMSLRQAYDSEGFAEWALDVGAEDVAYAYGDAFPSYSPRTALLLWKEMDDYLHTGTQTAQWLDDLLLNTNVSFIRNTLAGIHEDDANVNRTQYSYVFDDAGDDDDEGANAQILYVSDLVFRDREGIAPGASVRNKAGWVSWEDVNSPSICDAGIVEIDGVQYLFSIMTTASPSMQACEALSDTIAAIFDCTPELG